jgi:hypothetical protein
MVYFQTKNPNFGSILECLSIKYFSKFYVHLVCFAAISYILLQLGIFCGHFCIFCSRFGMLYQDKSGIPVVHSHQGRVEKDQSKGGTAKKDFSREHNGRT